MTQIPWEQKIKYKFIVDGKWLVHEDQPTEVDPGGFVNNIYIAPAKPVILPAPETTSLPLGVEKPIAAEANNHMTNGDSVVTEVVDKPEYTPQPLPKHAQSLTDTDGKNVSVIHLNSSFTFGSSKHRQYWLHKNTKGQLICLAGINVPPVLIFFAYRLQSLHQRPLTTYLSAWVLSRLQSWKKVHLMSNLPQLHLECLS